MILSFLGIYDFHNFHAYDMHLAAMLFEPGMLIEASPGNPKSIKICKNEPWGSLGLIFLKIMAFFDVMVFHFCSDFKLEIIVWGPGGSKK